MIKFCNNLTVVGDQKTMVALEYGVNRGRNGYGAIYVVASGNGALSNDNCNFDGYANSVYTVTIGAVDEFGYIPYYAEECVAMLAVALSSGGKGDRNIVTTDWTDVDGSGCTTSHTGTSAAAPLAASIIALMLQVRPCLTWRDVQYLIVITSVQINFDYSDWFKNAAGLVHSHHHGFGLMSAWKLVSASKIWSSVPWMSTYSSGTLTCNEIIGKNPNFTNLTYDLTAEAIKPYFIWIIEYVRVRFTLVHPVRGQLEFRLRCPSGTESVLARPRTNDKQNEGIDGWMFTTVRCWGEKPTGNWIFSITDHGKNKSVQGTILKWELIIFGTPMTTPEFQSRIRLAREAAENNVLDDNYSLPCRPPLKPLGEEVKISDKILQVLCFSGGFLFLLAVFETLEHIFCYDEEKKKFYDKMLSRRDKTSHQIRRNPFGTLESTPLMAETENDNVTCLEMSNHNLERYRGYDLMGDDIGAVDQIGQSITDDMLENRDAIVKDLSASNT